MNDKLTRFILVLLVVALSFFNYNTRKKHIKLKAECEKEKNILQEKTAYFKRNLNYSLGLINHEFFDKFNKYELIVFYTGGSCSSCLEDLLLNFKKKQLIQNKILIVTDTKEKTEVVKNFNDGFQTNFDIEIDSSKYFGKRVNDIIVLQNKRNHDKNLLEYRPENKRFFNNLLFKKS